MAGHNTGTLGICIIGREYFTVAQLNSLNDLLRQLTKRHPQAEVLGHCDLDPNKTCPNFNVRRWWNEGRQEP